MNKKITFTVEVSEELANKISNAKYLEGPKYQSYLRELFQESRKNGVSNAQNNNEPLWSFFERFTDASFAHFIRQESWAEFLRDIILDGIDERDEDEILEIINWIDRTVKLIKVNHHLISKISNDPTRFKCIVRIRTIIKIRVHNSAN